MDVMKDQCSSFSSLGAYGRAVRDIPQRLQTRMWAVWTPNEELDRIKERSGGEMQRKLGWCDVMALGVGGMVGAGILVTTGSAARLYAGPSVIVAYVVAGFSALLSAFCYTEFAVDMPIAGGAFSYLQITFGEFAAFLTGANLMMEYVISNAAVARSFTCYLAAAFGVVSADEWRFKANGVSEGSSVQLDFLALAILIILTIFLCYSTKDSSIFNMVVTLVHLAFIVFIIIAGFAKGNISNLSQPGLPADPGGFFPYGAKGVFNGAAIVYFSYIGYDAVTTLAEEVKDPERNLPVGVLGSVIIVTILYCLMAAAICMLVPYDMIDPEAPFPTAFRYVAGWTWASNVVGMGASLGIMSSLLVAMLGQARYLCVIGRAHVIPQWFAVVDPSTGTPINATIFLGICTAAIAFVTEFEVLLNLISIGTLFVFYMVANALLYRTHVLIGSTNPWPSLLFILVLSALAFGFATFWQMNPTQWWGLLFCGSSAVGLIILFRMKVPIVHKPDQWKASILPWVAATSIFFNVFLLASLDRESYERFGIWSAVVVCFYLLFSVHTTHDAETTTEDDEFTKMEADMKSSTQKSFPSQDLFHITTSDIKQKLYS